MFSKDRHRTLKKMSKVKYKGHPAQLPFHNDCWIYPFRAVFAGTGAGKSFMGGKEALDFAAHLKGSVGLIAEPTYKKINEVVIPTFKTLLGNNYNYVIKNFNKAQMRLDLRNGSTIWMIGLDKPEAAEGMNVDWCWLDEARLVPKLEEAMQSILRRLRGSGHAVPQRDYIPDNWAALWVTTTPDHPGSVLNKFFEGKDKLENSHVYRMSIDDNKENLSKSYIDNIKRTHTGGLYDRFVLGLFAAVGGVAFAYDYTIHTQDFKVPGGKRGLPVRYGCDFGWVNPSALVAVKIDSDGRAYVIDEIYARQLSMDVLTDYLLGWYKEHGKGPIICDRSRPDNIQVFVDAGLNAIADESKRDDGIADLGGRFQVQGDELPRIYIHPQCVNLIDEIQTYNPDKKERDHAVDGLRYTLAGLLAEIPDYTGSYPPMVFAPKIGSSRAKRRR